MLHSTTRRAARAAGCLLALPASFPSRRALAAAVAIGLFASAPVAALPTPADGETFVVSEGQAADAGMATDGRHVIAWQQGNPMEGWSLHAQVYTAGGNPALAPMQLAGGIAVPPEARVAMAPDGRWVVAYATGSGIQIHRYDSDANLQGGLFAVGPLAVSTVRAPSVAMSRSGDHYAAAWVDDAGGNSAVYARPFVLGTPLADAVQVSASGHAPAVAMLGDNDEFFVAWVQLGSGVAQVVGRHFDRFGAPLTPVLPISDEEFQLSDVRAAADFDGNVAIAWSRRNPGSGDHEVLVARFRQDTGTVDPGRYSSAASGFDDTLADVGVDHFGNTLVAFTREGPAADGTWEHGAQLVRIAQGQPSAPVAVTTPMQGAGESVAAIAVDGDGDALVVRDAWGFAGRTDGVHATRLLHSRPIDISAVLEAPEAVHYGEWFGYAVSVYNPWTPGNYEGFNNTAGFSVEVELPAGVTFEMVDDASQGWTCAAGVPVSCTYDGNLPQGYARLYLEVTAPQTPATLQATLRVVPRHADDNLANNVATAVTAVQDREPDAIAFADRTGVARGTVQTSEEITLAGFDGAVPVFLFGSGSYSLNGGAWVSGHGEARAGDRVRVRHTASLSYGATTYTEFHAGTASDRFTTVTEGRDTQPDAFAFVDVTNASLGLPATSQPIVVSGINDTASVSVTGGTYSINGAAFTSAAGSVRAGDSVRVQHTASLSPATRTDTTLAIGGVSDTFSSTTVPADTTPDAFAFAAQANVARGSVVTSAEATIGGINTAAPISIANGSYSINGGAFTSAAGTVANGQRVRVRHTAAAGFATATTSTLTVGGVQAAFTSTTEAADATPDTFSFAAASGVARSSTATSTAITVSGINTAAAISVGGGSYSVNGGAFTTAAGTVNAGDQVRVQHVASAAFGTATTTTLTIGGASAGFTSTTEAADATPNAFSFVDVSAKKNKAVTSSAVTITGINTAATVTVSGGGAKWSKNGGAFTTASGTVVSGDVIRLQVIAPASAGAVLNVVANVGGVTDTWTVTVTN